MLIREKKGIMTSTIVRMVIMCLCFVVLALVIFSVYNMFSSGKEIRQAKSTVALLVKSMNNADITGTANTYVYIPKNWYIVSFPPQGKDNPATGNPNSIWKIWKWGTSEDLIPAMCQDGKKCICVCSKPETCKKEEVCSVIANGKWVLSSKPNNNLIEISSVAEQMTNVLELKITSEAQDYIFAFNPFKINYNNLIEDKWFNNDGDKSTFEEKFKSISTSNGEKAESILEGAEEYKINPFLVMAILEVKYDMFKKMPDEFKPLVGVADTGNYVERLNAYIRQTSAQKEGSLATQKEIICGGDNFKYYTSDPLRDISQCISKVLRGGYDGKAEVYFGDIVGKGAKEINGLSIKPENKASAALWFYTREDSDSLLNIIRYYNTNYKEAYEK